jgi:hypothetical protein
MAHVARAPAEVKPDIALVGPTQPLQSREKGLGMRAWPTRSISVYAASSTPTRNAFALLSTRLRGQRHRGPEHCVRGNGRA